MTKINKKKATTKENPFDKFANPRKKHEILNRKVKGENRNVARARAKAVDERKKKLLKDFKANKKSNVFADKRFGENDADISLEERMFMRFQKEKLKKSRNNSLFNLDNDESASFLTHKGKVLGDMNMNENEALSSDDEDGLGKEVVNALHFGGGLVQKQSNMKTEDTRPVLTRADMLQDVIMKSKLRKLEKREAKEAQENSTEQLDDAFASLVSSSMLQFNPTRRDRSERDVESNTGDDGAFSEYDKSLRAMAFEAKVRATDRTKSAEEIATEAREKLEELEAARLRRMKAPAGGADEDEDAVARDALTDKQRHKRKRRRETDDDIDAQDYDDENAGQQGDAGEEDDWQRELAGEEDGDDDEDDEEDGEDGNDNDDDDVEEDVEEDEEDEEGPAEDEDEDEDMEDDWEEEDLDDPSSTPSYQNLSKKPNKVSGEKTKGSLGNPVSSQVSKAVPTVSTVEKSGKEVNNTEEKSGNKKPVAKKNLQDINAANDKMPHKIDCPCDATQFYELINAYVHTTADLSALLDRILIWNSVHLPGAAGQENIPRMHNFLDMLLRYFIRVGDRLCASTATDAQRTDTMAQLDCMTTVIFRLSKDLTSDKSSCSLLWGRLLKSFHTQLMKRLRDYTVEAQPLSCWPSLGSLLLLKTVTHVFSISDYRHAIVGPVVLFLCQCLSQCPVRTLKDLVSGLLTCALVLECSSCTEPPQLVPEVCTFLRAVLSLLAAPGSRVVAATAGLRLCTVDANALAGLRQLVEKDDDLPNENKNAISWRCFSDDVTDEVPPTRQVSSAVLRACHELSRSWLRRVGGLDSSPEALEPLLDALKGIRPHDAPAFPRSLQEAHVDILQEVMTCVSKRATNRRPLQWRIKAKTILESLTPKYETNYVPTKDNDPDRGRVEVKQLNRQLKREKKAAMRELTRDANFLDQEQYQESLEVTNRRKEERAKNFAWMEEQQATLKQQVKLSKGQMKGGGSGVLKRRGVK